MQPESRLTRSVPLLEPGGRADFAPDSPRLDTAPGRVAPLGRRLPLRPPGLRRRPGRTAGSPGAPNGTRGPRRSWCAPDPAAAGGRPVRRRGSGTDARRKPGPAAAGQLLELRGVSGFQNARDPEDDDCCAALSPRSGRWNGEWPRGLGFGRDAGFLTAPSASEVRSGQRCSRTQRSSASPPRNCQRSPGSDTSCAAQPAAVPGRGRGHKSPAARPIRCLFPGEAGATPSPGADHSANRHRGGTRELWEL